MLETENMYCLLYTSYANYFVLIDHFLFAKRPWKFLLCNVVLIAASMGAVHLLDVYKRQLLRSPVLARHFRREHLYFCRI